MFGAAKNTSNIREIAKYTPAFEPVSLREPSEIEKEIDATLQGEIYRIIWRCLRVIISTGMIFIILLSIASRLYERRDDSRE